MKASELRANVQEYRKKKEKELETQEISKESINFDFLDKILTKAWELSLEGQTYYRFVIEHGERYLTERYFNDRGFEFIEEDCMEVKDPMRGRRLLYKVMISW